MTGIEVERLTASEFGLVRPLLRDLYMFEQEHFSDHPQLTAAEVEEGMDEVAPNFRGENVVLAVRDGGGPALAGFCWCVFFDPGTGMEGEIAELFVEPGHRGRGVAQALVKQAVQLFRERGVTLGYVWTRAENASAVRLYESAGFSPTRQLVLTWYPHEAGPEPGAN